MPEEATGWGFPLVWNWLWKMSFNVLINMNYLFCVHGNNGNGMDDSLVTNIVIVYTLYDICIEIYSSSFS